MKTLRIRASDAPDMVLLAETIARYVNHHVHQDLSDMPEVERQVLISDLKDKFEERMEANRIFSTKKRFG